MKYKLFSVLIILAMVASISLITAAPALAQTSAASVGVAQTTTKAGQTSGYTVSVTTTTALSANDDVVIIFPAGTTVPDSIYYGNVTVNGEPVSSGDVGVDGNTVTVTIPDAINAGSVAAVNFSQNAGVKNPTVANSAADNTQYRITASTTTDITPVQSGTYAVTTWLVASTYELPFFGSTTVTGAGFKPGFEVTSTSTSGGALPAPAAVGSDGTFSSVAFGSGLGLPIAVQDGSGRSATTALSVTVLPRVSLTPDSGNVGSTVVVKVLDTGTPTALKLAGNNWTPLTPLPTSTTQLTDLDADGVSDDFQVAAQIPSGMAAGAKEVTYTNQGGGTAKATFTVSARAAVIDPGSGAPGSTAIVSGTGFPPNATSGVVMIILDVAQGQTPTIHSAPVQCDGNGSFTVPVTIPQTAKPGVYGITAAFGANTASTSFTVTATQLAVQPASGPLGTNFTISGGQNMIGTTGTVSINGTNLASPTPTITQPAGVMTPATISATTGNSFVVGYNSVKVTSTSGSSSTEAAGLFEVTKPTCTVNVDEVARGGSVVFQGEGWLPGQSGMVTITLTYTGGATTRVTYATPSADGSIYASMSIPTNATANQTATFSATDPYGNTCLTGTLKISQGKITLEPESGPIGTVVTVSGVGFPPQQGITSLTMNGIPVILGLSVLTDASGAFETTFTVPGFEASGYPVSATISGETASAAFQVTPGDAGAVVPATAFSTITDCIVIAWTFDAGTQGWQKYDPAPGATSDMASMVSLQGYWIQVSADCTLTYGNNTWDLKAGWNLIGWPS